MLRTLHSATSTAGQAFHRDDKILRQDGNPCRAYVPCFYLAIGVYADENGTEHASYTVRVTTQDKAALLSRSTATNQLLRRYRPRPRSLMPAFYFPIRS